MYSLDKYRYGVFRGEIEPSELNCKFWKLREELTGVSPPVRRSERDFDPPGKYHISSDNEYMKYLVANILQFQFHKKICQTAGEYIPGDKKKTLANCDIYGSKKAGNEFK